MYKQSSSTIKTLIDFMYPPSCLVCASGLDPSHDLVCEECSPYSTSTIFDFDTHTCCPRCAEQSSSHRNCLLCDLFPLPFRELRSLWWYGGSLEFVIKAMKYAKRHSLSRLLGDSLSNVLGQFSKDDWDLIIPLPSSKKTLQKRGFSHTALLAREVSRRSDTRFSIHALQSSKERALQVDLDLFKRQENLEDAFRAKSSLVAGKNILLVDDVITSGSSLVSAAECLLQAGAVSVDACTLARSPKFRANRLRLGLKKWSNA